MNTFHKLVERIRRGEPIPLPVAFLLSAATPLQRLGMWYRLRQPRTRVGAKVISFGNITVGGTGKTPAVIERARMEIAAGHTVAVLTRGYGARGKGRMIVAQGKILAAPKAIGDESALIAQKVPNVLIVKSADRVAAANKAITEYGCDTLILDDGFQHVRLERDENILLLDATNPFGNGRLIPRGILREPLTALARATHIVLTRCDQASDLPSLVAELQRWCPEVPIRKTCHSHTSLYRIADGANVGVEAIRGRNVTAVCAIGNPESFFTTLEGLGAILAQRLAFPDHAAIPLETVAAAGLVVTTEKDAIRMEHPPENVLALAIELRDLAFDNQ